MRKYLIFLLICIMVLSGCSGKQKNADSLYFYYYTISALDNDSENIIFAEPVHTDLNGMSLNDIVSRYLQGPGAENSDLPFSPGTSVVNITETIDNITVILSDECAQMHQLELSIAGSCLARTLFQFTQAQSISIETEEGFSYADHELKFTKNNIIVTDELIPTN